MDGLLREHRYAGKPQTNKDKKRRAAALRKAKSLEAFKERERKRSFSIANSYCCCCFCCCCCCFFFFCCCIYVWVSALLHRQFLLLWARDSPAAAVRCRRLLLLFAAVAVCCHCCSLLLLSMAGGAARVAATERLMRIIGSSNCGFGRRCCSLGFQRPLLLTAAAAPKTVNADAPRINLITMNALLPSVDPLGAFSRQI